MASELLLELMVRIAAHPDQWDEVHELLRKYMPFPRCNGVKFSHGWHELEGTVCARHPRFWICPFTTENVLFEIYEALLGYDDESGVELSVCGLDVGNSIS